MPKMKTQKSATDRFKISATGKIIRRKSGQRHLRATKSRANIRRGKEPILVTGLFARKIRRMLGL